jgi:hypothetical protein
VAHRPDTRRDPGQALRGSSDLHVWTDSACYLFRRSDGGLRLNVEHRAAAAPEALMLHLAGGKGEPCRLELDGTAAPPPPLADAVRRELRRAPEPLSRAALRKKLLVKKRAAPPDPANTGRARTCQAMPAPMESAAGHGSVGSAAGPLTRSQPFPESCRTGNAS